LNPYLADKSDNVAKSEIRRNGMDIQTNDDECEKQSQTSRAERQIWREISKFDTILA
jgi:hypothetical protein